ncbi:DUF4097 family beta strand repeat-containing protein [Streptococcus himalayensis]
MALSAIGIHSAGWNDIETAYGNVTSTEDIAEKDSQTIQKLAVDLDTKHVLIVPSLDDQIHIRSVVPKDQQKLIRHTITNGTLSIHEQTQQKQDIKISSGFAPLVDLIQHIQERNYNIIIQIPTRVTLESIHANVLQGDIEFGNISSQKIMATSGSGTIKLDSTNFKNGTFTVDTGIIRLEEVSLNQANIQTSGRLDIFDSNLSKTQIKATYNSVYIKNTKLLESTVSNPDDMITVFQGQINHSQLSTATGDIAFSNTSFTGNNTITSQQGDIQANLSQKALKRLHLLAETKQGELTQPSDHITDSPIYEQKVEQASGKLTLTSDTGDIQITLED